MNFFGKRLVLIYAVMLFWILIGVLGLFFETNFFDLSVYFLSLTGFVGTYVFSESVRRSTATGIFQPGSSSRREVMVYLSMLLWVILGVFSIVNQKELTQMAAYFGALTPFVAAAILGETYKKEEIDAKMGVGSQKIFKKEEPPAYPPYPPSNGEEFPES